ncbi:hypothetical protein DFH09DRAFT_1318997 [Mycena vulgaris]|nr:hypothetical protein DFH09DRAFT_1318997 [Mycena vulgaris]
MGTFISSLWLLPTPGLATTCGQPTKSTLPISANCVTDTRYGTPLYTEVKVSDVGYLREGAFHRLFNVTLPADHPDQTLGAPVLFQPLTLPIGWFCWNDKFFDPGIQTNLSPSFTTITGVANLRIPHCEAVQRWTKFLRHTMGNFLRTTFHLCGLHLQIPTSEPITRRMNLAMLALLVLTLLITRLGGIQIETQPFHSSTKLPWESVK